MKLYKRKWCPNLRWKKNKNVDKRIEICRNQHGEIRQYTDSTPFPHHTMRFLRFLASLRIIK